MKWIAWTVFNQLLGVTSWTIRTIKDIQTSSACYKGHVTDSLEKLNQLWFMRFICDQENSITILVQRKSLTYHQTKSTFYWLDFRNTSTGILVRHAKSYKWIDSATTIKYNQLTVVQFKSLKLLFTNGRGWLRLIVCE